MTRRSDIKSTLGLGVLASAVALMLGVAPAHAAKPPAAEPTPEQAKFFESKVRPLLVENCIKCHGEAKAKARLRLDTLEHTLKGGDLGPAVVPGDPSKSLLIKAVQYKDEDLQMPPDEELSPEQVKVLTDWVAMGAPWPADSKVASGGLVGKKRSIRDEDRQFWSFQPVKDAAPPAIAGDTWSRNPIDAFVLAKLKAEGLSPAPEADRLTLIRRATYDLHGMPPTPAEIEAFVKDPSPDAYEKLIERLLASPRYGERYGRHWMDVVRYAESDGFRQDAYRSNAWMYRDYVIASFNADKPYDQFVKEQLAGDELYPESPEARVATGYLRHGMYEYNQKNAEGQWSDSVNDLTDVTSDAFIGLSMGCARCHDHKFDPILQSDYFRLQAFLKPILPRNDLPAASAADLQKHKAALAKWEAKTKALREEIAAIEAPARKFIAERMIGRFPPEVQAMVSKPYDQQAPYERQLTYLVQRQIDDDLKKLDDRIKGKEKDRLVALRIELSKHDDEKPKDLPVALAATDVGPVAPETMIPGDPEKRVLEPGYPVVMDHLKLPTPAITASQTSTGRRSALAAWITTPTNPLTTRVITNRIWQWHFGHGLVRTSSDYGTLGEPPTHPELLDYLTSRFLESGWSMKAMHRLMMTSATYRQAALREVPEIAKLKDPENRWLWRMDTRRLQAEQIRDAMLSVSGELQLDRTSGPPVDYTAPSRTIYTKLVRNTRDPLLEVFDASESFGSVASRNVTTTPTQSLLMVNGDWVLKRAGAFAQRVARETPSADPAARTETAYRLAFGRAPTDAERNAVIAFLTQPRTTVAAVPAKDPVPTNTAPVVIGANDPMNDINEMPITQLMPQTGGQAVLMRNANPVDMLKMPRGDAKLVGDTFTVEGYVLLESLYESANVRVIASQWNGNQTSPGWSLGVTSERSKHQPRNLILQVVGAEVDGRKGGYEVIASNLRLELHRVYYVGVTVNMADTSEKGITFWLKDVGDMDAPLRSAKVRHNVTGPIESTSPLIIGGRDDAPGKPAHGWDGLIGEVRIATTTAKPDDILWNDGEPKGVVGHWRFEESPGFLKEVAGRTPDLVRMNGSASPGKSGSKSAAPTPPSAKLDPALIDLCHVLLNSNEFLYVD